MTVVFGEGVRLARAMLSQVTNKETIWVFLTSLEMVQRKILEGCGYELSADGTLTTLSSAARFSRPEFMEGLSIGVSRRVDSAIRGFEQPLPWRAALHPITLSALTPLEHLWMCMIAHIGYDLPSAIAAAEMSDPRAHDSDFRLTSGLLSDMVDDVQIQIRNFWPAARWLDALAGRADEHVTTRLVSWSRELAWHDGLRIRATIPHLRPRALRELALRCVFLQTQLVTASFVPLKLAGLLH